MKDTNTMKSNHGGDFVVIQVQMSLKWINGRFGNWCLIDIILIYYLFKYYFFKLLNRKFNSHPINFIKIFVFSRNITIFLMFDFFISSYFLVVIKGI